MSFDLRLLESFVAVAETRSFSVAAQRTNTVQSAISAHIKQLEQTTGRILVERGRGKPVSLTHEGTAFLVQARRLLLLADQILHGSHTAPEPKPLRIGTTITFALSVVPQALLTFAREPDAPSVLVKTARSHELMPLLDTEQIDLALVFDQGPHPLRVRTFETSLVWVASEVFTWPDGMPLPLAFLDDARDLRRHAFNALDAMPSVQASLTTCPDPIGLRSLLLAGLAVSIQPETSVTPPLGNVGAKLALPHLKSMQVSIYSRASTNLAATSSLIEFLISQVQANTKHTSESRHA